MDDAQTGTDEGGQDVPSRPDEHLTDGAELEVRADGANEPLAGGHPQLRPGEAGEADAAPTEAGVEQDDDADRAEREALIDRVEDERGDG